MLNEQRRPKTVPGIKRLANRIKKAEGIPHQQALRRAAQAASFENFAHARRALDLHSNARRYRQRLFLTAYWTDRETFVRGRETIEIELSTPLLNLCDKREMKLVGGLRNLRLVAPDHLVKDGMCPSQHYARDQLCKAVRALRFMEATGLRPCDYQRARTFTKGLDCSLPNKDHGSDWYDPVSSQFVLIDEPYTDPEVSAERADWARRNNWNLRASAWPGIYFPYRCALFVATPTSGGFDFDALMRKIDHIPDPITAEGWPGVSAVGHEPFASPMTVSPQDKRRAKAKGTIVPQLSKKTIPYHRTLIGAARKPNGKMSLAEHQMAGRMIRAVLQSNHKPWAVNQRMDRLMSTLVDWLYEDVPHHQLNHFYDPVDIYYGEMSSGDAIFAEANSPQGVVDVLKALADLLRQSYPDCAPLRNLVQKIDTSLNIIARSRAQ